MVRTRRHSDDFSSELLSLQNERTRQQQQQQQHHEQGEHIDHHTDGLRSSKRRHIEQERAKVDAPMSSNSRTKRHAYNIEAEDVPTESRLRPRDGPSHAYNYFEADSTDEETSRNRQARMRRSPHKSRLIKHEMLEEQQQGYRSSRRRTIPSVKDIEREEDMADLHSYRRPRRHPIPLVVDQHESDEEEMAELQSYRRSRRRTVPLVVDRPESDHEEEDLQTPYSRGSRRRTVPMAEEREEEDMAEILCRRSLRKKRQQYDNLNQSDIMNEQDAITNADDGDTDLKEDEDGEENQKEEQDMYSRVKRKRVRIERDMYGVPIETEEDKDEKEGEEEEDDDVEEEEDEVESRRTLRRRPKPRALPMRREYSLREHKPRTVLYKAPMEETKRRERSVFITTPTKRSTGKTYQSPAQRRDLRKRRTHHSSSTSSSPSGDSSDEEKFQRRKSKSMNKARSKMKPMNFTGGAVPVGPIKDRIKSGASLADVEPMDIDKSVTFDSIGGLAKHVRALKEMVVFPLLYEKVFERFKVDPPKGCLFYGPPGTGKTLVARALANECSQGDKKVAFFMRKGADCLSKWVGESERQLRLLFDQAYKYRPSIIFFDEIDGLAPVRSSRQDQIHSSIVSTLLALMDGLDSRGQIVVIGATNRIDSIDPALRRPGRFDREFLFGLPTLEARHQILQIHTSPWTPKLNDAFIGQLAQRCVGYCGADLKALCTEAAMTALRRRYPQIYFSKEALELDASAVTVSAKDFADAMSTITPTSQRSVSSPARGLSPLIMPLLDTQLKEALAQLMDIFPACSKGKHSGTTDVNSSIWDDLGSDEEGNEAPSIFVSSSHPKKGRKPRHSEGKEDNLPLDFFNFASCSSKHLPTFRPRLMLAGPTGHGQTTHLGPAILHHMESLPTHTLDLPGLYANSGKSPEEACAHVFQEARRKVPSVVYLPQVDQLWSVLDRGAEAVRAMLLTLLTALEPSLPLLVLATTELPYDDLHPDLHTLFDAGCGELVTVTSPGKEERTAFFQELMLQQACRPPPQRRTTAQRMMETLPKAEPPKPRELSKQELKALEEKEELTLMELRIFLRDVLNKLGSDRKFSIFAKPVDIDDAPDYYEVIEKPMDLSTMMQNIDLHHYPTVATFMRDVDLICFNALEYNPSRGPMDRIIRHRACALKDTAYAIIKTELDKEFEKTCVEIEESRKRRGQEKPKVPTFYYKPKPANQNQSLPAYLEQPKPTIQIQENPDGERFSRRLRGITIDPTPALEVVEKKFTQKRSASVSPVRSVTTRADQSTKSLSETKDTDAKPTRDDSQTPAAKADSQTSSSEPKKSLRGSADSKAKLEAKTSSSAPKSVPWKKKVSVWCKPKRKRRRLNLVSPSLRKQQDGDGKEEESQEEDSDNEGTIEGDSSILDSQASSQTNTQTDTPTDSHTVSQPMDTEEAAHNSDLQEVAPLPALLTSTPHIPALVTPLLSTPGLEDKPSVVKRLNLDAGPTDSGISSSADSNGDSRDGLEHGAKDASKTKDVKEPSTEVAPISPVNQELVVDREGLAKLLATLVDGTQGCCVEKLERVHAQLNLVVQRHRGCWDRTAMLEKLDIKVHALLKMQALQRNTDVI